MIFGARSGATILAGCGLNVRTAAFHPCSREIGRRRSHQRLVSDVNAVEVADGGGARAEIAGHFVEAAEDARALDHAAATSISRPS